MTTRYPTLGTTPDLPALPDPTGASESDSLQIVGGVPAWAAVQVPTIPALASTTPAALGVAAVGVGTTAARADHVHALPTIPAVSSATPAALGVASAGVSAEASRADHVHARELPDPTGAPDGQVVTTASGALVLATPAGGGPVTDDFSSAVPWTAVNGGGTAAVSGGVGSCSVASGASANTPNRASLTRALPAFAPWQVLDVAVRLASFTGTLGAARALLNLSTEPDGANDAYTGAVTDFGVSALRFIDGSCAIGDYSGGSGVFSTRATTAVGVVPADGTGFLRIILRPDSYTVLTGVGASYAAAVWTPRCTQAITWAARAITNVSLAGYRSDVQAETHTVTWDDLVMVVR